MMPFVKPKTFIAVVVLFLLSCKKDNPPPPEPDECMEDGLPCLTTEGKNMFACKVDGTPWIAETPYNAMGPNPVEGEYDLGNGFFYIRGFKKIEDEDIYQYITIYGYGIFNEGNDSMRSITNPTPVGYEDILLDNNCEKYYHDTLHKGILEIIRLDTTEHIISGRFSMQLFNEVCASKPEISVTNGRFDYKYQY